MADTNTYCVALLFTETKPPIHFLGFPTLADFQTFAASAQRAAERAAAGEFGEEPYVLALDIPAQYVGEWTQDFIKDVKQQYREEREAQKQRETDAAGQRRNTSEE